MSCTNCQGATQGPGQAGKTNQTNGQDPMSKLKEMLGQLNPEQLMGFLRQMMGGGDQNQAQTQGRKNQAQNQEMQDARVLAESLKANGIKAA